MITFAVTMKPLLRAAFPPARELVKSIPEEKNGRSDWTRTSDPLTPSQVRYQTAPRSDLSREASTAKRERVL